jgi:hypothetical protein
VTGWVEINPDQVFCDDEQWLMAVQNQEQRDMNADNTQGGAEPSLESAGSHGDPLSVCCRHLANSQAIIDRKNAEIERLRLATARLSAANTWLQEEINSSRLRPTDEELKAIQSQAVPIPPRIQDAMAKAIREARKQ